MHVPISTGKFRLFGSPITDKSAPSQESVVNALSCMADCGRDVSVMSIVAVVEKEGGLG